MILSYAVLLFHYFKGRQVPVSVRTYANVKLENTHKCGMAGSQFKDFLKAPLTLI